MARAVPKELAEFIKWCEDRDIWPTKEERDDERRLISEESMTWIEVLWEWCK